ALSSRMTSIKFARHGYILFSSTRFDLDFFMLVKFAYILRHPLATPVIIALGHFWICTDNIKSLGSWINIEDKYNWWIQLAHVVCCFTVMPAKFTCCFAHYVVLLY